MTGRIGIALGDVTGIGPEVALKAIALSLQQGDSKFLVIGDAARVQQLVEQLHLRLTFERFEAGSNAKLLLHDPLTAPLPSHLEPGSPSAAQAALAYLKDGAQRCLRGELDALVTAPVNKEAIIRSGQPEFTGQTEFLSGLAGTTRTAMMLLGEDDRGRWLRVALVTMHLPLKNVAAAITQEKVELAIEFANRACRDLSLNRARIGVCGLNPHAGEGGKIGTEEVETITPAVRAAAGRGLDVVGPLAADTLFYYAYRGDYDAVVAMYHDQGLAPLKMIGLKKA